MGIALVVCVLFWGESGTVVVVEGEFGQVGIVWTKVCKKNTQAHVAQFQMVSGWLHDAGLHSG